MHLITESQSLHQGCVLTKIYPRTFQTAEQQLYGKEKMDVSGVEQQEIITNLSFWRLLTVLLNFMLGNQFA